MDRRRSGLSLGSIRQKALRDDGDDRKGTEPGPVFGTLARLVQIMHIRIYRVLLVAIAYICSEREVRRGR
jgi:hypothetical protein